MRVLHIEVGGMFGGSLAALKLYLRYSRTGAHSHDLLLYYPTVRTCGLRTLVDRTLVLRKTVPQAIKLDRGRRSCLRAALSWVIAGSPRLRAAVDILRALPLVKDIQRIIVEGCYDVVHLNNTFTYQWASLIAAHRERCPIVANVLYPLDYIPPLGLRILNSSRALVVSMNPKLAVQVERLGVRCPIEVIWINIEAPPPVEHTAAARVRAELGVSPDDFLVGSVGRLVQNKDYETFVRAVEAVSQVHRQAHFVIAGEGPGRQQIESLIAALGLFGKVRLLGHYPDSHALMSAMDVFVCSSTLEGGPLVLLEAMLLAAPVVTTDVGLASEVVETPRTGTIVPPGDSTRLAQAIIELLGFSTARRREIAAAGQRAARRFADPLATARQLDAVFARVGRTPSPSPAPP